jgi:hypothetical protein
VPLEVGGGAFQNLADADFVQGDAEAEAAGRRSRPRASKSC